MWKDPIAEEVRKHRREIELECKGDLLIFAKAKKIEKTLKGRLVSKVSKKRIKDKSIE